MPFEPWTIGRNSVSISAAMAAGPYVYPSPVSSPASTSTTTIVVESHARVPSDSGSSVGTVCAETDRRSTATSARVATAMLRPARERLLEFLQLPPERFLHHADELRVSLRHRLRPLLGLFPADVRRQRRDLGIDGDLEHDRALRRERL